MSAALVACSLPPLVEGQLRCFLSVKVDSLKWAIPAPPKDVQIIIIWWGQKEDGFLLRPVVETDPSFLASKKITEANFPVRCGPKQFSSYLKDMGSLCIDVLYGPSLVKFAKVEVDNIDSFIASKPLAGWYPVICCTAPYKNKQVGELYLSFSFKTISDAYNVSSSIIPTTDQKYYSSPATKKTKGRKKKLEKHAASSNKKQVKISQLSPDRISYNISSPIEKEKRQSFIVGPGASHTQLKEIKESDEDFVYGENMQDNVPINSTGEQSLKRSPSISRNRNEDVKGREMSVYHTDVKQLPIVLKGEQKENIVSSLLSRGWQLRDKMIKSSIQTQQERLISKNQAGSGSLLEELLDDNTGSCVQELQEEMHSSASALSAIKSKDIEVKAVDLILGNEDKLEDLLQKANLSHDSEHEVSDDQDPLHDSSLLSELFYTTKPQNLADESSIIMSDDENDDIVKADSPVTAEDFEEKDINNHATRSSKIENSEGGSDTSESEEKNDSMASNFGYAQLLPDNISVQQLTVLGRTKSVKVYFNTMLLLKQANSVIYFVECQFPVSFGSTSRRPSTELIRIVSRSVSSNVIDFKRVSVFPMYFDENMIHYWWNNCLCFTVYRKQSKEDRPIILGKGFMKLREVLTAESFSDACNVEILDIGDNNQHTNEKEKANKLGDLQIEIQLINDQTRHDVMLKRTPKKVPLNDQVPGTSGFKKNVSPIKITMNKERAIAGKEMAKDVQSLSGSHLKPAARELYNSTVLQNAIMVDEGRDISFGDYPGLCNLYFICRVFWTNDDLRSKICWNTNHPNFQYQQVVPVVVTTECIHRMKNNFMIIEVWHKSTSTQNDKLIGMSKLSLHQYFLSCREPHLMEVILKSKYPVVSHDGWIPVMNLCSAKEHGSLKVLLALGTHDQIIELKRMHVSKVKLTNEMQSVPRTSGTANFSPNQVEQVIEITIESVKGMKQHEKEVWGETDCFVQYHFPDQKNGILSFTCFQSKTTLCTPNPVFNHTLCHQFTQQCGTPLQKILLQGFSASANKGEMVFELWKRHYYPNVRDQLVAKATLPVAKLYALITMHGNNDVSAQSFRIPFKLLDSSCHPSNEMFLEVFMKYKCATAMDAIPIPAHTPASLSVSVLRLCGLKSVSMLLSNRDKRMTYYAGAGVNASVRFGFSFTSDGCSRTTHTVAQSFSPTFNYHAELSLPALLRNSSGKQCLAELVENGSLNCEVFHEFEDPGKDNILIGRAEIPLHHVLSHVTGFKGWWLLESPLSSRGRTSPQPAGGIQLEVKFLNPSDREVIVNHGRGAGWCPTVDVQLHDEAWMSPNDVNNDACYMQVVIDKLWLPKVVLRGLLPLLKTVIQRYKYIFARYKLYDQAPTCTHHMKLESEGETMFRCNLSHSKSFNIPPSTSFAWYLREEKLELQFWLSSVGHDGESEPKASDKLIGSVFVNLASFSHSPFERLTLSERYNLYRVGADVICEAHARVSVSFNEKCENLHPVDHEGENSLDYFSDGCTSPDESVLLIDICTRTNENEANRVADPVCANVENEENCVSIQFHIDEALHLTKITQGNVVKEPSVYVSYQIPGQTVEYTKICFESVKPKFNFQKLLKLDPDLLKTEYLEFKVWRAVHDNQQMEKDILIGVASVDTAPLFVGMRQILGWYNIQDLNTQVVGQLKIGINPSKTLSPSRSVKFFKNFDCPPMNLDLVYFSKHIEQKPNLSLDSYTNTSKSMLFEQLKQNLCDLSELTSKMKKRIDCPVEGQGISRTNYQRNVQSNESINPNAHNINADTNPFQGIAKERNVLSNCVDETELSRREDFRRENVNDKIETHSDYKRSDDGQEEEIFSIGDELGVPSPFKQTGSEQEMEVLQFSDPDFNAGEDQKSCHSTDELMEHLKEFETKYKHLKDIAHYGDHLLNRHSDDYGDNLLDRHSDDYGDHLLDGNSDNDKESLIPFGTNDVVNVSSNEPSKEDIKIKYPNHFSEVDMTDTEVTATGIGEKGKVFGEPLMNENVDFEIDTDENENETSDGEVVELEKHSTVETSSELHCIDDNEKIKLPNFFMQPREMSESIKALRIAANFRHAPRQLKDTRDSHDIESRGSKSVSHSTNVANKSFKDRLRNQLPVEASEMARIASIFASKNV